MTFFKARLIPPKNPQLTSTLVNIFAGGYWDENFVKNIGSRRIDPRQSARLENRTTYATTHGQICADFDSQLWGAETSFMHHKTNFYDV